LGRCRFDQAAHCCGTEHLQLLLRSRAQTSCAPDGSSRPTLPRLPLRARPCCQSISSCRPPATRLSLRSLRRSRVEHGRARVLGARVHGQCQASRRPRSGNAQPVGSAPVLSCDPNLRWEDQYISSAVDGAASLGSRSRSVRDHGRSSSQGLGCWSSPLSRTTAANPSFVPGQWARMAAMPARRTTLRSTAVTMIASSA
jgi:hypothetical protein